MWLKDQVPFLLQCIPLVNRLMGSTAKPATYDVWVV